MHSGSQPLLLSAPTTPLMLAAPKTLSQLLRFGPLGDALFNALPVLSPSVSAIVGDYLFIPPVGALGISIGCTSCCVAVSLYDKPVTILVNGSRTMPAYVAFTDKEVLVGEAAKQQPLTNSKNTIVNVKSLIGQRWDDAEHKLGNWPFTLQNEKGRPVIEVQYKGERRRFAAEETTAMMLRKLVEEANEFLGQNVKSVVLTVPPYFNDAQRQATKDAGTIAGLNVLRIINEPTAVTIACGLDKASSAHSGELNVVVVHIGGRRHEVTLLSIEDGIYEVKATASAANCAGYDIDNILRTRFIQQNALFDSGTMTRYFESEAALNKLHPACEQAKIALSIEDKATISVEGLIPENPAFVFTDTVTRDQFEHAIGSVVGKLTGCLDQILRDSRVAKAEIHEIILTSGSSRIPKLRAVVEKFFGKDVRADVDPIETVAAGAAIQGAILSQYALKKYDVIG